MIEDIIKQLKEYIDTNETGCLEVRNLIKQEKPWLLYFAFGVWIWSNGGQHQGRRIYRQIKKHCPEQFQQGFPNDETVISEDSTSADYDWLCDLRKNEDINVKQFIAVQDDVNTEVLFDILQTFTLQNEDSSDYDQNSGLQWQWFPKIRPANYIPIPSSLMNQSCKTTITAAQQKWQKWQKAGLKACLPNQAPIITDAESIKQATAAKTFENLKRLVTGKQTLREIAVDTKREVFTVTQALWGYYKKGWLHFQDVPDFNLKEIANSLSSATPTTPSPSQENQTEKKQNKFVVACVDDSPQVTQTMEGILRESGYDFIGINDPLRANATLLKAKPDLIFLDLIMPMTNGYEICTQLRRVSSLQEIPIIILTGKDGIIDRMRAKMAGSTEYLSKPVQRRTILEVVQKYLPTTSETSETNSETLSHFS